MSDSDIAMVSPGTPPETCPKVRDRTHIEDDVFVMNERIRCLEDQLQALGGPDIADNMSHTPCVYLATCPVYHRIKAGLWSGNVKKLISRYMTYFGRDLQLWTFDTRYHRLHEAAFEQHFADDNISMELFVKSDEKIAEYTSYLGQLTGSVMVYHVCTAPERARFVGARNEALFAQRVCAAMISTEAEVPVRSKNSMLPTAVKSNALPAVQARMLIQARPVVDKDDLRRLVGRVLEKDASEDDKWAYYLHRYKLGWGIDVVTPDFVAENGTETRSPKVVQLMRILFPALHVVPDTSTAGREGLLRAPLIQQTIAALGFRSPFDTEHVVPNLMACWRDSLVTTEMFQKYKDTKRLFHNSRPHVPGWDAAKVVKAINMVLGAVGLRIVVCNTTRTRAAGSRTRLSSYTLDADAVATMVELVKLKTRSMHVQPACDHVRDALDSCTLPKYGCLIDNAAPSWRGWDVVVDDASSM
jgi:hypothetical protein